MEVRDLTVLKNKALENEIYLLEQDNKRLRKRVNKINKERLDAYQKVLEGNRENDDVLTFSVGFLLGMVASFIISTIIIILIFR